MRATGIKLHCMRHRKERRGRKLSPPFLYLQLPTLDRREDGFTPRVYFQFSIDRFYVAADLQRRNAQFPHGGFVAVIFCEQLQQIGLLIGEPFCD
jgi:hypothetical protein